MFRPVIDRTIVVSRVRFPLAGPTVRGRGAVGPLTFGLRNRASGSRVRRSFRFFGAVLRIRGFLHGGGVHPRRRRSRRRCGFRLGHALRRAGTLWCGSGVVASGKLVGLGGALADSGTPGDAEAALETVHAGRDAARGVVGGGQEDACAQQFEVKLRGGGPGHLVERGVRDVRGARELRGPELGGLIAQPIDLVGGHAVQDVRGRIRHRVDHHQVAETFQQVFHESARVLAGLNHTVD